MKAKRAKARPAKRKAAKRKPTIKERKLVEGVLRGKSGAQAARDAGYSARSAREIAHETLTKPHIQERIKQRIAEAEVSTNEVLGTLASHMRGDITDLFDEGESPILDAIRKKKLGHLIKKIRVKRVFEGEAKTPIDVIELELHGAQTAAIQLSKIKGMEAAEKVKHEGQITHKVVFEFVDDGIGGAGKNN